MSPMTTRPAKRRPNRVINPFADFFSMETIYALLWILFVFPWYFGSAALLNIWVLFIPWKRWYQPLIAGSWLCVAWPLLHKFFHFLWRLYACNL